MNYIQLEANKSRLIYCLNDACDLVTNITEGEIKVKALELYKERGFVALPFLVKSEVFKAYFS